MNKTDIANYSVSETLKNGKTIVIRAIRPDDRDHLAGVLGELSSESFYRRTFASKRELSEQELTQIAAVDFNDIVALVAVMKEQDQDRIVGGGRYIRMDGRSAAAEVAFLIDDAHQGLGIGSRIFRNLVEVARASGITRFEAEVLPTNNGMMRLFDRSGLKVTKVRREDTVHLTIDLTA